MSQASTVVANRYELLEVVGTTGLASVHRARDTSTDSVVAVKVFRSYFCQETEAAHRYLHLMQRVQTLRHPNIVHVHRVDRDEGTIYVVMDYVPWPTLKSLGGKQLLLREIVETLRQVAAALDHAHSFGVVHGDLRPSNVFIDSESGQVKVSDFGTATLVEGGHALVRSTVSTPLPSYTPPEQIRGEPPIPRNDIYSLGALLYELATGSVPFDALSPQTVLRRQVTTVPAAPTSHNPDLPPEFDAVVLKALSLRPEDRHTSGATLVSSVEELARAQATASTSAPARAVPGEEVISAPLEDERVVCPKCGTGNPASAPRCSFCWGTLSTQPTVTRVEEQRIVRRYLRVIRRKRRLVLAALGLTYAILIGAYVVDTFNIKLPLPSPASDISSVSNAGEWAMLRHNPDRTGGTAGTAFVPEGTVKWRFSSDGPLFSSPAVADGLVYFGTSDRRIVALGEETGALHWTYSATGPVNSSPAVAGDFVFVGLRDGTVLALKKATGKLVWSFDAGFGIYSSPVVLGGVLYIGSGDGNVYAFDAATGEKRWRARTNGWVVSSSAVSDGIVAVGSLDGKLYLIDASTGALRFKYGTHNGIDTSVIVVEDRAYTVSGNGRLHAIELNKRNIPFEKALWRTWFQFWIWGMVPDPPRPPGIEWIHRARDRTTTDMATDGEQLFVAYHSGFLRAHDLNNFGRPAWEFQAGAPLKVAPIVVGDAVIQAASDGTVYGVHRVTGQKLWATAVNAEASASPVLANGTLYVPTENGTLYAIR